MYNFLTYVTCTCAGEVIGDYPISLALSQTLAIGWIIEVAAVP